MEITFNVKLSIGYPGAVRNDQITIEVDDNATPEEITKEKDIAAEEWMGNFIDLWHD